MMMIPHRILAAVLYAVAILLFLIGVLLEGIGGLKGMVAAVLFGIFGAACSVSPRSARCDSPSPCNGRTALSQHHRLHHLRGPPSPRCQRRDRTPARRGRSRSEVACGPRRRHPP